MTDRIDAATFKSILSNYISKKNNDTIHVNIELSVNYEDISMGVNLKAYYVKDEQEVPITETDIREALTSYMDERGYILNNYLYDGYVRKMGMYTDTDTPVFFGIILYYENQKIKQKKVN